MSHTSLMKQAWHYMRYYRVLWLFGVILALTTPSWSGISLLRDEDRAGWQLDLGIEPGDTLSDIRTKLVREIDRMGAIEEANRGLDEFFLDVFDLKVDSNIGPSLIYLLGFMALTYLLAKGASYVAETAMIRSVALHENTGQQHSLRQALGLGWSRSAGRLILIDLAMVAVMFSIIGLLLALGIAPWMLWGTGSMAASILGTITSIGIFILGAFLMVALLIGFSFLKPIVWRACVLENVGVLASLRRGVIVARQHMQDAGLTWLVTLAVRLTWPLLLAPVVLLLSLAGGALGGMAAWLTYEIALLAAGASIPVLLASGVGISVLILVMAVPLTLLGSLREVFLSSLWTLTYQALPKHSSAMIGKAGPGGTGAAGAELMASS